MDMTTAEIIGAAVLWCTITIIAEVYMYHCEKGTGK